MLDVWHSVLCVPRHCGLLIAGRAMSFGKCNVPLVQATCSVLLRTYRVQSFLMSPLVLHSCWPPWCTWDRPLCYYFRGFAVATYSWKAVHSDACMSSSLDWVTSMLKYHLKELLVITLYKTIPYHYLSSCLELFYTCTCSLSSQWNVDSRKP